jgi:hypothetical protein
MAQLYLGQIDPDKIDKSKIREYEDKNGNKRRSISVSIWVDSNPSEDWKAVSIQQSTKKEEDSIYLGNAKKWERQTGDITPERTSNDATANDPLPF